MKTAVRNSVLALLSAAGLLCGCARPSGDNFFVSTGTARSQGGSYDFTLQLDDTTGNYALRLAARLVGSRLPDGQLALDIHTTAADGSTSIERKTFALDGGPDFRLVRSSGSVVDCEWLLQEDLRIDSASAGTWQIRVTPTDTTLLAAIYGIGLSYRSDHGKR